MPRSLRVKLEREAAMTATRVSVKANRLVYVLVADKRIKYRNGRSAIVYIGTTKRGMTRMAYSVAKRASDILGLHGVRTFHARVLTCTPRQSVKTWHKLERALLLAFRDELGEVPHCNTVGVRMKETDEFAYFRRKRINALIRDLG